MSELVFERGRHGFNKQLLMTVSAIALSGCIGAARASEMFLGSDNPPIWIEAGGDYTLLSGTPEQWAPTGVIFVGANGASIRKDPVSDLGLEGKISYQPQDNWILSLSARYGRTQRLVALHSETNLPYNGTGAHFYNANATRAENHTVIDFQVGKDVGLGAFGHDGQSLFSFGIRMAQFVMTEDDLVSSNPKQSNFRQRAHFHSATIRRSVSAVGPSVSWDGAGAIIGSKDGGLWLEGGASAAVLFGRQKFYENAMFRSIYQTNLGETHITSPSTLNRQKMVTIPNIGGNIGVSYRFLAAKISIGYRADLYFNAMDGGVATAHSMNRSFYGPFATVSLGIQ